MEFLDGWMDMWMDGWVGKWNLSGDIRLAIWDRTGRDGTGLSGKCDTTSFSFFHFIS